MEIFNSFINILMHALISSFLILYLPLSWICRLILFFVKPFFREDVKGKVALITGASSGIGEELAYQYASRGAILVLVARREKALRKVAKASLEMGSPDVLVIKADLSSQSECKRVVDEAISHFAQLNHLVVNAGILSSSLFEEITDISAFSQVMNINFWGAVYTTYYAIPHLKNCKGNIIVLASAAGHLPIARMSFYSASKAALIKFYETLRAELGSDIRITIVTPGYVASELTMGKILQKGGEFAVNEELRDVQIGFLPIGCTYTLAKVVLESACNGDEYVTWPSWYHAFNVIMFFAPEVFNLFSRTFYITKPGVDSSKTLGRKILEATGAKRLLYPSSIRSY